MSKKIAKFQVVRKDIDDSHYYWLLKAGANIKKFATEGMFVPGSTTILGDAGPVGYGLRNFWMANGKEGSDQIMKESGDFGTSIHDAIERLLYGEELDLERDYSNTKYKDARKHLMSFHDWFHAFKPDIKSIKPEFVVGSWKYKYAGTLDLFCTKGKENWLIDFKTGSGIYSNHERQIASYKQAYEEMTGKKIHKMGILRTGTRHKVGYEFRKVDKPFASFLNVYKTYLDENGGKIPKPPLVDVYPEKLRIIK